MKQKPELHLFIIWEQARGFEKQILGDINQNFEILDVFEVRWGKKQFPNNLMRFYGVNLPAGTNKQGHVGRGPFLVILVADKNPVYRLHPTSKGDRSVNSNTFTAKTKHREWTGGGHKIHATNSVAETAHDLALLFGIGIDEFLRTHASTWDGKIKKTRRNLSGSEGWKTLAELFDFLNAAIHPYVVLRNFEVLPNKFYLEKHGDIDLLVDDYAQTQYLTNSTPVFAEGYRVLNQVKIGSQDVLFDFRYKGDGYYDTNWQADTLAGASKVWSFYAPSEVEYFYTLLYHGLIHKPTLSQDYVKRLFKLAKNNGLEFSVTSSAKGKLELLARFMFNRGYTPTFPKDASVDINYRNVSILERSLL